jgi:DNA-binding XRE family transcriptional regulator
VSGRIRDHVQDRRGARGWLQEQMARRTGLSRTAISAIGTGAVLQLKA